MNRVTSGIFGVMGVLTFGGVLLNDITGNLTGLPVDPEYFIMFILASIVAWVFYIGVTVSKGGSL